MRKVNVCYQSLRVQERLTGWSSVEGFIGGKSIPVLVYEVLGDDFGRIRLVGGDANGVLDTLTVLVGESVRSSTTFATPIPLREFGNAMEPFEEIGAPPSAVPALGTGPEEGEDDGPATVAKTFSYGSGREILELGRECEADGEGSATDETGVLQLKLVPEH
ncbi:hypothetical protein NMY22_g12951 [Coprinellus aureogranulatus]|nr:hypothetical protein NMY22_g12951 [Coprinellus aureogranulatus]